MTGGNPFFVAEVGRMLEGADGRPRPHHHQRARGEERSSEEAFARLRAAAPGGVDCRWRVLCPRCCNDAGPAPPACLSYMDEAASAGLV